MLGRLYDKLTFQTVRQHATNQTSIIATANNIDLVMNTYVVKELLQVVSKEVAERLTVAWLDAHKVAILDALAPGEVANEVRELVKGRIADAVLKVQKPVPSAYDLGARGIYGR